MLLGSRSHTAGDTRRWIVSYEKWLDNAATIESATLTSSSTTCTVNGSQIKGKDVVFFVHGGTVGETCTISITMTDNFQNVKKDTLAFTVVAP